MFGVSIFEDVISETIQKSGNKGIETLSKNVYDYIINNAVENKSNNM